MEKTEKKVKTVKRKKKAIKLKSGDFWLMLFTLMLVIFGVIMVFSASYYYSISQDGNAYSYLLRHGMWVLLGFGVMILGAAFDYRRYKKFALPIFIASVLLLILVLTPLGQTTNGATRWIRLGPVTIMPGEIAKIAAIMFVAWFLSEDRDRIKSLTRGILPLVGVAGLYGALIIMQPNLSTAITVCGIIVAMMLVAGLKWRYVLTAGGVGAAGILSILLFMKDSYWYSRLTSFGVGLGKSIQKNLYLPEPQNDFILAIIGEELGFVGILLLIVLYCLFIWRGVHIAVNAPDQFGMLLASGIILMVAIQVILNIAVVTSSMPATGINLPFISYSCFPREY